MQCPSCAEELLPSHKFCPSCAAPVSAPSQMPTAMAVTPQAPAAQAPVIAAPIGRLVSSDSIPVGGYTPGMVLADRYRIIGLIGRGGMGEVYRADDLKLGQPVALKFLPKALSDDPVRRERFYAEVRIARQVSHPNICRVYDIGELDGRHFLTMEFIDGEDLASLLKRIGNLHGTKALDVARQLCAGLAAAHDKGVLHRDLKPANVMLDGRGRVRVTDFGLAVAAGEEVPAGEVSGTPAYMAPEQFAGKGASVRSDIYALGLVLYELYTGKRAFDAKSLAELRARKEGAPPPAPSEVVRDIDPVIERVILRCLEKDPRQRPASVAHVATALPGGDPLAAAIAAGETPSPEMVEASGSTEGLRPWIAWSCLVFVILGIAATALLARQATLVQLVPMDANPGYLVVKAREILRDIGYSERFVDSATGFVSSSPTSDPQQKDRPASPWTNPPALAIQFWYRQSPHYLERWIGTGPPSLGVLGGVDFMDPPMHTGEAIVWLDARGSLTGLRVIPREGDKPSGVSSSPDWTPLFKDAGLDLTKCTPVEPIWILPTSVDVRAAWTGVMPDRPDLSIRVEAAAYHGKPVFWRLKSAAWTDPSIATYHPPPDSFENSSDQRMAQVQGIFSAIITITIIAGAAFLARRNLRMGRGDRRGAMRLACFYFVSTTVAWLFAEHHAPTAGELQRLMDSAARILLTASVLWMMYLALEPYLRRRWPEALVALNRVFTGRFRDPLVGRDMLIGCVAGAVSVVLAYVNYLVISRFGASQIPPFSGLDLSTLDLFPGAHMVIACITGLPGGFIRNGFMLLFFVFLLRILLRRTWATIAAVFVIAIALEAASGIFSPIGLILGTLGLAISVFVLLRFGVVAYGGSLLFEDLLIGFPITTQLSAWYSGIGLTGLALLLFLTLYAFHTSLGGQPLFGRATLED